MLRLPACPARAACSPDCVLSNVCASAEQKKEEDSPPSGPLSLGSTFKLIDEAKEVEKKGSASEKKKMKRRIDKCTTISEEPEEEVVEPLHNTLLETWRGKPPPQRVWPLRRGCA